MSKVNLKHLTQANTSKDKEEQSVELRTLYVDSKNITVYTITSMTNLVGKDEVVVVCSLRSGKTIYIEKPVFLKRFKKVNLTKTKWIT